MITLEIAKRALDECESVMFAYQDRYNTARAEWQRNDTSTTWINYEQALEQFSAAMRARSMASKMVRMIEEAEALEQAWKRLTALDVVDLDVSRETSAVHNHGTEEDQGVACPERILNGVLIGDCRRSVLIADYYKSGR